MSEWKEVRLEDVVELNPIEIIQKGKIVKKIKMEKLQPFCKEISEYEFVEFNGGSKFRNDDTLMARITPCLENGKIAKVSILDENEIGFGSTEFIVFRAKKGLSNPDFLYYLIISSNIRNHAIKSMVGSSGRQRVQTNVLKKLLINLPDITTQQKIASILSSLDDKIELNNRINGNLEQQAQAIFKEWFVDNAKPEWEKGKLSELFTVSTESYSKSDNWEIVNYLDTGSITKNCIEDLQTIILSEEKLPSRAQRKIHSGDIVFSSVRPNQKHFGLILTPHTNMLVSTGFVVIHSDFNFFIYYCLTQLDVLNHLQSLAEQSVST